MIGVSRVHTFEKHLSQFLRSVSSSVEVLHGTNGLGKHYKNKHPKLYTQLTTDHEHVQKGRTRVASAMNRRVPIRFSLFSLLSDQALARTKEVKSPRFHVMCERTTAAVHLVYGAEVQQPDMKFTPQQYSSGQSSARA